VVRRGSATQPIDREHNLGRQLIDATVVSQSRGNQKKQHYSSKKVLIMLPQLLIYKLTKAMLMSLVAENT
jgi:hypothetical protein